MVPSHCHVWPCDLLWPMGVNVTQPHLGKNVQNKFRIRLYLLLFSLCFENNIFQIGSASSTWLYVKKIHRADPQRLNRSNCQVTHMRNCFVNHKHCGVCYHRKANALHTWCYSQSSTSQKINAIYWAHLSQGDLLKSINHIVLLPCLKLFNNCLLYLKWLPKPL